MGKETVLPKNIRQIGEIRGREKICLEDYVMTYIRKKEQQEEKGYLGIFLGEQQRTEDFVYVFIRGILEVPEEKQEEGKEEEKEETLKERIEKERRSYFPDCEVQGCCVIGTYPAGKMEQLTKELPSSGQFLYHLQEQEETLYWMTETQYVRLRGYFVFYEQNRKMQEYLAEIFPEDSVEKESLPDKAMKSFREKVKEKGLEKHMSMLKLASSFFVLTVLVAGAVAVNRVEDMRAVRSSLSGDITPENEVLQEQKLVNGALMADGTSGRGSEGSLTAGAGSGEGSLAAGAGSSEGSLTAGADSGEGSLTAGADSSEGSLAASAGSGEGSLAGGTQEADSPVLAGSNAFWEDTSGEDGVYASSGQTADDTQNLVQSSSGQQTSDGAAGNEAADTSSASVSGNEAVDMSSAGAAGSEALDSRSAGDSGSKNGDSNNGTAAGNASPENAREASSRQLQASYIIREGDTLADICNKYYGSLDRLADICQANEIADANLIMPGQKIVLPQ